MAKAKAKRPVVAQSARFLAAAKEAGVDESGAEFERVFKKIVPVPKPANKTKH